MSDFKPLLAAPVDFSKLDYTNLWASVKLDGIRAIVRDGVVLSRSLKPIPNDFVQARFGHLEHYDGELIVGPANAPDVYRTTNSAVMSRSGQCDVTFHAFDHVAFPDDDYVKRYARLSDDYEHVVKVDQHTIFTYEDLLECEEWMLDRGFEGVMLRAYCGPESHYKFGRSTAREGTLIKIKRMADFDAVVIGSVEEMENRNEATTNALGRTERSSHKANLVGKARLGALVCKTPEGIEFNIGGGFDHATRVALWRERETLPGRIVKYKSFVIGVKDAPRFPVFLGWRDPLDM